MKTDVVKIDNQGAGFSEAVYQTRKAAEFRDVDKKGSIQLQLMTEEMLSLIHSLTGERKASFWLESEGKRFEMHLTTNSVLDSENRSRLISSSTANRNEAAASFLGRLIDAMEQAAAKKPDLSDDSALDEAGEDVYNRLIENPEWDRYEQSILRRLADSIKVFIRGELVHITVIKQLAE
ncbi:MAG: hypothetical protein II920_01220 [Clostridia bacterium]|nr:hypothetical protein [Clostridia bacterium]